MTEVPDAAARREALDPTRSFIVQAPAGSGKTELLIQRVLTLLAQVNAPEEIIAITFTRKAAGEMRQRVTQALARAAPDQPAPSEPHRLHTWQLAVAALAQDRCNGWNLLQNPGRLRIQTIDSLCMALTRQMPWLSRLGNQPDIAAQPELLYREAARRVLADLENNAPWTEAIAVLLARLDNQPARLESMLVDMLARRDQWLRHVLGARSAGGTLERHALEAALQRLAEDSLAAASQAIPRHLRGPLGELAHFAGHVLGIELTTENGLPPPDTQFLAHWCGLADWLLTQEGEWRKTVTAKQGFLAPSGVKNTQEKKILAENKQRMLQVLEELRTECADRAATLNFVRQLPALVYEETQWQALQALVELLPVAVAQLQLVFCEQGAVDYSEIAQRAAFALGAAEEPTDLALALDYAIRHILMDEFQDTSLSQFELLERLVAGWEPNDGRTLFLVGDPMQSIYRFREAEVGLFLRARQHGLGAVALEPLTLSANFRSQAGIVEWVNQGFSALMPKHEDIALGAVPYSPSHAVHVAEAGLAVRVHALPSCHGQAEAQRVVELVRQALAEDECPEHGRDPEHGRNPEHERRGGGLSPPDNPEHGRGTEVAILVRARSHATVLLEALKNNGIAFQAVDLDSLATRPVVRDALALTRALLYPADRLAWLAVLRAPWCGLRLVDLHAITTQADAHTPPASLRAVLAALLPLCSGGAGGDEPPPLPAEVLSEDARTRLARVAPILVQAAEQCRRQPLAALVRHTWLALGGAACLANDADLADAEAFWQLLQTNECAGEVANFSALQAQVAQLYAASQPARARVMTLHKAKGLEFDTVIVPGLHRMAPAESRRLLLWLERPGARAQDGNTAVGGNAAVADLLLAPVQAENGEADKLYRCLSQLRQQKDQLETARLLYVAATRAKRRLHWLAECKVVDGETPQPPANSLLRALWPLLEAEVNAQIAALPANATPEAQEGQHEAAPPLFARLAADWQAPKPPAIATMTASVALPSAPEEALAFDWASEAARHVGTVAHDWLRRIAQTPDWLEQPALWRAVLPAVSRAMLLHLGVRPQELAAALQRVSQAVENTVNDPRGRWILSNTHSAAECEYALSGRVGQTLHHVVIDRTFIDSHGVRWIIDYKTGMHSGGGLEHFLESECTRYAPQLREYGQILALLDTRPIRLGLYFPLHQAWREWAFDPIAL